MKKIKIKSLSSEVKTEIYNYIKKNFDGTNIKLPTEDEFSDILGVSRVTIRTALNELASDGIIFRKQGRGTFINPQAVTMKVQFNPVVLFKEMIMQSGYTPSVDILGYEEIRPDKETAGKLGINENDNIIMAKKVFYADKKPCVYCEDYFSKEIFRKDSDLVYLKDYKESIFDFIYTYSGRKISWDRVEILTVTNHDKKDLNTYFHCEDKLKSFLLLEGINFDQEDRPVIFAKEYIDTNYICFNSIRKK